MREFLGEAGVSKLCRLTKNAIWEAIANSRLDGVTLESIAITSPPDKTRYAPGECFDPTGMAVRALFSNGQTSYIRTENLTFTPSGPLEDAGTARPPPGGPGPMRRRTLRTRFPMWRAAPGSVRPLTASSPGRGW